MENGNSKDGLRGLSRWRLSLSELRSTRAVAFCGVMCALGVVLNFTTTVNFGPHLRVGFSGLPNQAVDFLLGPAAGVIFASAMDVIKYLLRPDGVFFPGYTFSAALAAAIYGTLLYRRPPSLFRVVLSHFIVKTVVNLGFNTFWHSILLGKAMMVMLPPRVLANALSLPVDAALTYFMIKLLSKTVLEKFRNAE